AVDYALQAWAKLWNKPQTKATNDQALAYLEKARALDPTVPEIWTNLAYAHARAAAFGWSPSRSESVRLNHEAAERAVALAPQSADAHYGLAGAMRFQGDLDRAFAEYETVVALNPNHAPGHAQLGWCWVLRGRPQEALPSYERAFRLSPRD